MEVTISLLCASVGKASGESVAPQARQKLRTAVVSGIIVRLPMLAVLVRYRSILRLECGNPVTAEGQLLQGFEVSPQSLSRLPAIEIGMQTH
jgi:hypothetical protein